MKYAKKILSLLLVLTMVLSMAACGKNNTTPSSTPTPGGDSNVTPEPAAPKTYTYKGYAQSNSANSHKRGVRLFWRPISYTKRSFNNREK